MTKLFGRYILLICVIGTLSLSLAFNEISGDACEQLGSLHAILSLNDIPVLPVSCFFLEPNEDFLNFDEQHVESPVMLLISGFEPISDQWFHALHPNKGVIESHRELQFPEQGWVMTTSVTLSEEDLKVYADARMAPPKGYVLRADRRLFQGDYAWFVLLASRK